MEVKAIYNAVSIVFLVLTVLVCLMTTVWLVSDSSVPGFLQPSTDVPLPPTLPHYTWTPSLTPSLSPTPRSTWTPIPTPG